MVDECLDPTQRLLHHSQYFFPSAEYFLRISMYKSHLTRVLVSSDSDGVTCFHLARALQKKMPNITRASTLKQEKKKKIKRISGHINMFPVKSGRLFFSSFFFSLHFTRFIRPLAKTNDRPVICHQLFSEPPTSPPFSPAGVLAPFRGRARRRRRRSSKATTAHSGRGTRGRRKPSARPPSPRPWASRRRRSGASWRARSGRRASRGRCSGSRIRCLRGAGI